jgi:hypothetical protein
VIGANGSGPLGGPAWPAPRLAAGYETYRRMRRDPTIALARALAVAPVVAGKWAVQADADVPQEVCGWIDKQFLTVREPLLETILKHGYVDFGHQGFELIWGLDAHGRQCVARFKPLLPDITEILIDAHGGLAGLRQRGKGDGSNLCEAPSGRAPTAGWSGKLDLSPFPRQNDVVLTGANAMLVSFGGEGSNLYGEPLLENVREVWNDWRKANEVAARYDRKIAGAYLLLHYPSFGQGIDQNGAKLDNVYLAQRILDKLEAASGVAIGDVPSELAPGQDPNQTAWRLEVQGRSLWPVDGRSGDFRIHLNTAASRHWARDLRPPPDRTQETRSSSGREGTRTPAQAPRRAGGFRRPQGAFAYKPPSMKRGNIAYYFAAGSGSP